MTKKKVEVAVIEDPEKPVKKEILAEAIVKIGEAMRKLSASGLNERAIIVLVYDALPNASYGHNKVGKTQIAQVFDALKTLESRYCRR